MDMTKLGYFVAVADERHFGRAAQQLYVTPSAVSVGIRALERQLGVELFDRTSRRVELTDAGHALLPEARDLLRQHDAFRAAVRRHRNARRHRPVYTIGVHDEGLAELTPDVLTALRRGLPEVEFRITALSYAQLPTALADGLADAVFGSTSVARDDDDVIPAYRDPRVVQINAESDHARAGHVSAADVLDLPMLAPPARIGRFERPFYLMDQRNGEEPHLVGRATSLQDYLLATAVDGVVQYATAATARFFPHPGVRYVPLSDVPALTVGAIFPAADRTVLRRDVETIVASTVVNGHLRVPQALPATRISGQDGRRDA